jgi:hypothetical protein
MADFSRARESVDRPKQRREQFSHAVGSSSSLGNKKPSSLHVTADSNESHRDVQTLANILKELRNSRVKQIGLSYKLHQDKLKATGEISIGDRSLTSILTELTASESESTSLSCSTHESPVRIVLDEGDESEHATGDDLKELLVCNRQLSAVVEDDETISVSIKTADAGGTRLYFQENGSRGEDDNDQLERPILRRKASAQSNKGQRERAHRTASVKSKKVVAKRKVDDYFQSDKIQRNRQGSGETECMSHRRSSGEDALDEFDDPIDGAARLREMYGEEVDKQRQQHVLGLSIAQYRSARHGRECRNRLIMHSQKRPEHEMKRADLDHDGRRDVLGGMRAEIEAMKKQGKGNRRSSRRAKRQSIMDDCESEASSAQVYSTGSSTSGWLTVNQPTVGANKNLLPSLCEHKSVADFCFVSQMRRTACFDDDERGTAADRRRGKTLVITPQEKE